MPNKTFNATIITDLNPTKVTRRLYFKDVNGNNIKTTTEETTNFCRSSVYAIPSFSAVASLTNSSAISVAFEIEYADQTADQINYLYGFLVQ